jgi:hypothetical protein
MRSGGGLLASTDRLDRFIDRLPPILKAIALITAGDDGFHRDRIPMRAPFGHKDSMTRKIQARLAALVLTSTTVLGGTSMAMAGQPLTIDDAAVVDAHTCQVEGWMQSARDEQQYWIAPACNLFGNVELSVGAARIDADASNRTSQFQLQGKTVLIARGDGAWSFGAEAGAQRDTGAEHGRSAFQTYYAKGLASYHPSDDVEVDFNLGIVKTHGSATSAFAGTAVQYSPIERLQLLGEVFHDEPGRAKYQVAIRYALISDRLEAFISYGNRFGGSNDWWSIAGFRWQSAALFP